MSAGTILVREALRRVSVDLNDMTPQFQRFAQADLINYLNDGALSVVTHLPALGARVDSIRLSAGTRQSIESITAANVIPSDGVAVTETIKGIDLISVMRNMGQDGSTPGRAVRVVARKTLDMQDPLWHTVSRAKNYITSFMADPMTPRVFYVSPPVVADEAVWAEVSYSAQPSIVPAPSQSVSYAHDGSNPTPIPLPDDTIAFLVPYVCARAHMRDTEWSDGSKAQYYEKSALAWLNAKVQASTGTNPNLKRLPMAPQQMANAA